ncbi:SNARE associated Golgi protein [Methanosarcina siciliae C2J]|uniref:SNARE associated Golgi protein n=1 Tax=Methanosarcina siciliae C2J TaxID=1434118 RepID=A0A0E3PPN3_9EURY|nr:YqaA family protein [Methanosarcina siciliae]AKB37733.1 SNARE associated Golgi protein [Methanosarcina siciliae C2J]
MRASLDGKDKMLESLTAFIIDYGYLHLFVLSFLASTVLPLGSEALVIALVYQGFSPFAVVMVATIGNFLGSCTTYYLGLKGRNVLERYLSPSPEKLEKSERLFNKYGVYTLLFTWVPGIGDAITMVAGLMQLSFRSFSILVFLGKFGRYLVLAYSVVFFNGGF